MSMQEEIDRIAALLYEKCASFLSDQGDSYIDPIENKEIIAHYGFTHFAVGTLIRGIRLEEPDLIESSEKMVRAIVNKWNIMKLKSEFHADFNMFALCVYEELTTNMELKPAIKEIVINTKDSKHLTINWLPMRLYVNYKRYGWTSDEKYLKVCMELKDTINRACYADGYIDDRLPKGTSFNLQYDISTVALLVFLNNHTDIQFEIADKLGALVNAIMPDGDINYQGRGSNQIFAWGPWIYLLNVTRRNQELDVATSFIMAHTDFLDNNNIMLNEFPGESKYLWWDYHYSSVYLAHFQFWTELSLVEKKTEIHSVPYSCNKDSGIRILKDDDYFIFWFNGRSEYLAESGPSIASIWTRKHGTIFKGSFGPWGGRFGEQNLVQGIALNNSLGMYCGKVSPHISKNRILRKIQSYFKPKFRYEFEPVFTLKSIKTSSHHIELLYTIPKNKRVYFSFPVFEDCKLSANEIQALVDGKEIQFVYTGTYRNQYGSVKMFQTRCCTGAEMMIRIHY